MATRPPKECGQKEEIDEIANKFTNSSSIESISISSTTLPTLASSSMSSNSPSTVAVEMATQRNILVRNFIAIHLQNLNTMIGANVPENGFVKIENYLKVLLSFLLYFI